MRLAITKKGRSAGRAVPRLSLRRKRGWVAILIVSILALLITAQAEATCFSGYQLKMEGPFAHAGDEVVGLAGTDNRLFAVTRDDELWERNAFAISANPRYTGPYDLTWRRIGSAYEVVAMAATPERLFAVTSNDQLWARTVVADASWQYIGYAPDVVALAATNGRLYAATSDDRLWIRAALTSDASWHPLGYARDVVTMAASGNRLFAVSEDDTLWTRDLGEPLPTGESSARIGPWRQIDHAYDVVALASVRNTLFAFTDSNQLLTRQAVPFKADWKRAPDLVFVQGASQVVTITLTVSASADPGTACNIYAISRIPGVTLTLRPVPIAGISSTHAAVWGSSADWVSTHGGIWNYSLQVHVSSSATGDGVIEIRHDTRDPREEYEYMPLLGTLTVQILPPTVAP